MFIQQRNSGLPNIFGQDQALCPFDNYDMWRVSVESILSNLLPYRVALVETAAAVLDLMPGNQKIGFVTRVSYFICPLENDVWQNLETLHCSLDNLSSEGNSCVVTLEEILANSLRTAYGHDQMLRLFFVENCFAIEGMTMYPIRQ